MTIEQFNKMRGITPAQIKKAKEILTNKKDLAK
jgi:hypothetical protein